jgi:PHD/YefM family antitoxin component YafN of YafNO toxin-antitoxin module
MKGIQFVTDAEGHKVAVVLDLREWGELWEDIYDNMLAKERAEEPSMTLDEFEAELRKEGLVSE